MGPLQSCRGRLLVPGAQLGRLGAQDRAPAAQRGLLAQLQRLRLGRRASRRLYTAACGGGYIPDPASAYQATVKKAVADAIAAGLYVILDLHWGAPNNAAGQPLCPIGQPACADNDHSLAFWTSLADTFKADPPVMFELCNEPFGSNGYGNWVNGASGAGPDATTLRDGGAFFPFLQQDNSNSNLIHTLCLTWQVAGMQDMINTIRGEGATNVILASPIGWAGEIETWPGRQAHRSDRSARRRLARLTATTRARAIRWPCSPPATRSRSPRPMAWAPSKGLQRLFVFYPLRTAPLTDHGRPSDAP